MTSDKLSQKDLYDAINDFRREVAERFDKLDSDFEKKYVPMERFLPIERIVNGIVSKGVVVIMGILLTILSLVVSHVIPGFRL